ncbi:flagellin [Buttiauxella gaviniae]|uniref:Flagellin n=1 Tax=Buttiauxella gaviniae TaxID=82990 RepID=A0ABV3NQ17_9ENTR
MALSIFTSGAAMSSTNALNKSNSILSTAMERLGTGKRINSAADDAAGLQIATRLQGQVNGMGVAQRNVSDATAMLQSAEGAFDEVTNILYRMKDLATQAANDTNGTNERDALQAESDELNKELKNILTQTKFGGESLIFSMGTNGTTFTVDGGKLGKEMAFQIGADKSESLKLDLTKQGTGGTTDLMDKLDKAFGFTTTTAGVAAINLSTGSGAAIDTITTALDTVGTVRSTLGANINRLGHTSANLANMKDNTTLALGNIRDADFASEATNMTRNQMLAQTSMSMLKQANSMSGMVMSLLG